MSDVFVSYARSTAKQAQAAAKALRGLGYSVWLDEELPSHRTYSDVIEEQLASTKAALVIWSAEAVKSQWVKSEANAARQRDKLVQMTIDGARLPMPFDQIQCADLNGWIGDVEAPGWHKVIASIAELVGETAGSQQTSASAGTLPPRRRHNLPAQLTSFIGRQRELAEVSEMLAAHRLVTLVGVGGCGKTRLALAIAKARLDDFPDGVWLVELAPVTDPDQVMPAVAKVLGVQPSAPLSLRDALLAAIENQHLLVVLDNCEHLLDASAELAEAMLLRAPALRVLATSREALGIAGEHAWRINSLAVPDPAKDTTVAALAEFDSVRVFVDRAAVAAPGFALSAGNTSAIARICKRLDGIPLALELAAARLQTLSVDDIATRLDQNFKLLTGGSRTALPRQRTLQATLDWSHGLLPEPARVLLRRLSAFTNGFTLAAAEAVGGSDPLDADDVIDLLTRLVEQSMVQKVGSSSGAARYRLLEPVRQYGQERLNDQAEAAVTRDRHAAFFAAAANAGLEGALNGVGRESTSTQSTADDLENFLGAAEWLESVGDFGDMAIIVTTLGLARVWKDTLWRFFGRADVVGELKGPIKVNYVLASSNNANMLGEFMRQADFARQAIDLGIEDDRVGHFAHYLLAQILGATDPDEAQRTIEVGILRHGRIAASFPVLYRGLVELAIHRGQFEHALELSNSGHYGDVAVHEIELVLIVLGRYDEAAAGVRVGPDRGPVPEFRYRKPMVLALVEAAHGHSEAATQQLAEAMRMMDRWLINLADRDILIAAAALAYHRQDFERASMLLAVERQRLIGGLRSPAMTALYKHYRDLVRAALDRPTIEAARLAAERYSIASAIAEELARAAR